MTMPGGMVRNTEVSRWGKNLTQSGSQGDPGKSHANELTYRGGREATQMVTQHPEGELKAADSDQKKGARGSGGSQLQCFWTW